MTREQLQSKLDDALNWVFEPAPTLEKFQRWLARDAKRPLHRMSPEEIEREASAGDDPLF